MKKINNKKIATTILLSIFMALSVIAYISPLEVQASPATNTYTAYFHRNTHLAHKSNCTMNSTTTGFWSAATATDTSAWIKNSTSTKYDNNMTTVLLNPDVAGNLLLRGVPYAKIYLKGNVTCIGSGTGGAKVRVTATIFNYTAVAGWTTMATGYLDQNVTTSYTLFTVTMASPAATVTAGAYLGVNITLSHAHASLSVKMAYDTLLNNSRIDLECIDHITVDSVTWQGSSSLSTPDPMFYNEELIVTITVSNDFGLYDVVTVYQWFGINNDASQIGTSTTATGFTGFATNSSNTGEWTITGVTPQSYIAAGEEIYYNTQWKFWSGAIDRTADNGGDEAGSRGGDTHTSSDSSQVGPKVQYSTSGTDPDGNGNGAEPISFFNQMILNVPVWAWLIGVVAFIAAAIIVFASKESK